MKNLFIITTPFQLLGALEAIEYFKLNNNILVIIDNNLEKNREQITSLIEKNNLFFNEIVRHGEKNKSKFLQNFFLVKKLQKIEFNNIYIGDLGSIQKIIISNLQSNKIYLLDDGAKTILIHKKLKEKSKIFKSSLRQLRFSLLGLKTSTTQTISIFSFFNLDRINNCEILKHEFGFFKKVNKLKSKNIENKVFILGQPIVENHRVKKEAYEKYLNFVISENINSEIYYLMHRREDINLLNSYKLNTKINFIESRKPGEFFFSELNYIPKTIYGVNTTLMYSLSSIFNNLDIYAYVFNNNEILKNHDWFKESIKYFGKNNIKLIGENVE